MLDLIFLLLLSLHPPGSLSLSLSQTKTSDPPEIKCPDHLSSANARNRPRGPFPSLPSRPPSLPICGLLPFYPLANRLESSPPLLVFPVPPSSSQSSQQPPPPPPLPSPEPAPPGVPMFPQKDLPSLRPSSARPSLRSSVVCLSVCQPVCPSVSSTLYTLSTLRLPVPLSAALSSPFSSAQLGSDDLIDRPIS
ncbi:hypothetical protein MPTK1_2g19290 [Marchantia polymorpha subsp. ruderalis]